MSSHDIEQGSSAWFETRLGKVTSSRVSDVVARTKTGWGASRANYLSELVCERLTGKPTETYTNAAMQWGKDKEPEARSLYEFMRDTEVQQVGFIDHPSIVMAGASPDGLCGTEGMVELKCPNTATHIETMLGGVVPQKYVLQMQWQMACAQRSFVDFCSYDPRLPENMRLFVKRIERDDKMIADLEQNVRTFLAEVEETVEALYKRAAA